MRFILAFALLLFSLSAAAGAQQAPIWTTAGDRMTLNRAGISFPARAGTLSVTETKEFSHPGESLDAVAQYRSPDAAVVGTVYVYYPGVAHSGLAALATDQAIKLNSRNQVTSRGSRVVAAGGHRNVAIRTDYSGYMGNNESSAAFIKAGRWMVKIRVSAPERRKTEVAAAMEALLEGVRFPDTAPPHAAVPISTPACPSSSEQQARMLADDNNEIMGNAIIIGAADAAGRMASENGRPTILPSRIGEKWCRNLVTVGQSRIPVIRATDAEVWNQAIEGKSLLFALYSDAGGALEVVRVAKTGRFLLLNHEIGATNLLASFDAIPSDRQMAAILSGADEGGRMRARVELKADGKTEVQMQAPPAPPVSPTT